MVDRLCLAILWWNTWAPPQKCGLCLTYNDSDVVAVIHRKYKKCPSEDTVWKERAILRGDGLIHWGRTTSVALSFVVLVFLFLPPSSLIPNRRFHPGCCQTLWVSCGRVGISVGMSCHIWQHKNNRVRKSLPPPLLKKPHPSIPRVPHKLHKRIIKDYTVQAQGINPLLKWASVSAAVQKLSCSITTLPRPCRRQKPRIARSFMRSH